MILHSLGPLQNQVDARGLENGVLPQEMLRGIKEAGCMGGTIGHSQKSIEGSKKDGSNDHSQIICINGDLGVGRRPWKYGKGFVYQINP